MKTEYGSFLVTDIFRKHEIVELSNSFQVVGYGDMFLIKMADQYIKGGEIVDKSKEFQERTETFKNWLNQNFVTARGKNCYDSFDVYEKIKNKLK